MKTEKEKFILQQVGESSLQLDHLLSQSTVYELRAAFSNWVKDIVTESWDAAIEHQKFAPAVEDKSTTWEREPYGKMPWENSNRRQNDVNVLIYNCSSDDLVTGPVTKTLAQAWEMNLIGIVPDVPPKDDTRTLMISYLDLNSFTRAYPEAQIHSFDFDDAVQIYNSLPVKDGL